MKKQQYLIATVLITVTFFIYVFHYLLLLHVASSRLLENMMTNGASLESLSLVLIFFLLRIMAIVFMPAVIVLYIVIIGRKLLYP